MHFMAFDLDNFKRRAIRVSEVTARTPEALSKVLFRNVHTLPGVLDDSISPRFKTLQLADQRLSDLEAQLETAQ